MMSGGGPTDPIDYFGENELDVIDWVLSLFYAAWEQQSAGNGLPSQLYVQGALFIASRYIPRLGELLEFRIYRGGPWSEEVYDALEIARVNAWIVKTRRGLRLSDKGLHIAGIMWNKLGKGEKEILRKIVSIVSVMTRSELLIYLCTLYGCNGELDAFNEPRRERKKLALSILRKNLVSVELAAKMAGMPLPYFIKYLEKIGYKPYTVEE